MLEPLVPRLLPGGRATTDRSEAAVLRRFLAYAQSSKACSGHHNHNYVVPLTEDAAPFVGRPAGTDVTVRIPRATCCRW